MGVPIQEELEIKKVSVPGAMVREGYVYYDINVSSGYHDWTVIKRYSAFEALRQEILLAFPHKDLPTLPPKHFKLFTAHLSAAFIEERRALLDNYIKKLVGIAEVGKSQQVVNFLSKNKAPVMEDQRRQQDSYQFPPDQEVTHVSIPSTRTMSDHVLYQIDVSNAKARDSFSQWTVLKRFGQFYEMDQTLRTDLADQPKLLTELPSAPPRKAKLLHDHMDADFIEQRRVLLENYITKLLHMPKVASNKFFLEFLGVSVT